MAKIYISSTYSDLSTFRQAVYRSLRTLGHDVIAMEDYVATDKRPLHKCLAEVETCDIYVAIVAWKYGHVPDDHNPDKLSITELEYRRARELKKPCLVYLLTDDTPWPPVEIDAFADPVAGSRINELRQRLKEELLVDFFGTPEELANRATVGVVRTLEHPPGQLTKLKVFLCHGSEDKKTVRELYDRLKNEGHDPWLDEESIVPGQEWRREITKALHDSNVVLVCLSRSTVTKTGYVQKEIREVLDLADMQPEGKVFVIPVKLDECVVPDRLSRWQWVDYFEPDGHDRLSRALQIQSRQLNA